jgi:hypothetical protein
MEGAVMKIFQPEDETIRDMVDAFSHASDLIDGRHERYFAVSYNPRKPLKSILNYDDYSSWGEISEGELLGDRDEILQGFRGKAWSERSSRWQKPEDVPAIMLIEWNEGQVIGDGRGRVNLAVGMKWKHLPAYTFKEVSSRARHDFSWMPVKGDFSDFTWSY